MYGTGISLSRDVNESVTNALDLTLYSRQCDQ